jgi:unsaturated rhamnogalacturonyl hydrolase
MTSGRELVRQVADSICDEKLEIWNFGESVAFEGLVGASEVLGDATWEAFAWGYLRSWAASRQGFRELDCTFPGVAAARIARTHDDLQLVNAMAALVSHLLERPTIRGIYRTWRHAPLVQPYGPAQLSRREAAWLADPPAGSFLDCLHFEPPLFAAVGVLTGQSALKELAVRQAMAYVSALQQPDGLFDHFVLDGVPGSFGPGWGRGQGWALLGLLDVIEELGGEGIDLSELQSAAVRLIRAMVDLQRPDGHWYTQVAVPESGDEFSTAGFMAAGFRRAIRLGVVESAGVSDAAAAAHAATLGGIGPDGVLANVSAAVMACTEPTHYDHVPRGFNVPWGQGPALLALVEQLGHGWQE